MQVLAGTSGFSYKEWKGSFYPEKIAPGEMLRYYAERLPALEIDNTFYRLPRAEVLAGWARQVPDAFRFTIKASRKITHFKRLKDAEDETDYLLRVAQELGQKMGGILFQLPPNMKKDRDRLARFLDLLPPPVPVAFEFREPSWYEPDVLELLREHGQPVCVADMEDAEDNGKKAGRAWNGVAIPATGRWGYLRLRREAYDDAALQDWLRRIEEAGWDRAYVFFKHEDAGVGPALARRFLELAGIEAEPAAAAGGISPILEAARRGAGRHAATSAAPARKKSA